MITLFELLNSSPLPRSKKYVIKIPNPRPAPAPTPAAIPTPVIWREVTPAKKPGSMYWLIIPFESMIPHLLLNLFSLHAPIADRNEAPNPKPSAKGNL